LSAGALNPDFFCASSKIDARDEAFPEEIGTPRSVFFCVANVIVWSQNQPGQDVRVLLLVLVAVNTGILSKDWNQHTRMVYQLGHGVVARYNRMARRRDK